MDPGKPFGIWRQTRSKDRRYRDPSSECLLQYFCVHIWAFHCFQVVALSQLLLPILSFVRWVRCIPSNVKVQPLFPNMDISAFVVWVRQCTKPQHSRFRCYMMSHYSLTSWCLLALRVRLNRAHVTQGAEFAVTTWRQTQTCLSRETGGSDSRARTPLKSLFMEQEEKFETPNTAYRRLELNICLWITGHGGLSPISSI